MLQCVHIGLSFFLDILEKRLFPEELFEEFLTNKAALESVVLPKVGNCVEVAHCSTSWTTKAKTR